MEKSTPMTCPPRHRFKSASENFFPLAHSSEEVRPERFKRDSVERPGSAARLLRLPRRALGPSAHVKSDRERVRDGASSNREDERSPVGEDCQAYGVQTRQRRRKNMATIEGRKSVAENRPRHQIPKRHRGHQNVGSPRRLIDLVTQSPA